MSSLRAVPASARAVVSSLPLRSRREGVDALGDAELLTLLLTDERPLSSSSAAALARELRAEVGGLRAWLQSGGSSDECGGIASLEGMPEAPRLRLEAALELGRRVVRRESLAAIGTFPNAQDVAVWAHAQLGHLDHEEIWLLALDVRHGLVAARKIAQGGMSGCTTSSREILRCALRVGAASFLLVHNHPSGDPTPSVEDARMTRHVGNAAEIVGVPLLDHVVVGGGTYVSLFDLGLITSPKARGDSPRRGTRGTPLRVPHV